MLAKQFDDALSLIRVALVVGVEGDIGIKERVGHD